MYTGNCPLSNFMKSFQRFTNFYVQTYRYANMAKLVGAFFFADLLCEGAYNRDSDIRITKIIRNSGWQLRLRYLDNRVFGVHFSVGSHIFSSPQCPDQLSFPSCLLYTSTGSSFSSVKAAGSWNWLLSTSLCPGLKCLDCICTTSYMCITQYRTSLPLFFTYKHQSWCSSNLKVASNLLLVVLRFVSPRQYGRHPSPSQSSAPLPLAQGSGCLSQRRFFEDRLVEAHCSFHTLIHGGNSFVHSQQQSLWASCAVDPF